MADLAQLYKKANEKFLDGKFFEALSLYYQILSYDMESDINYYNVALTQEMMGDIELAIANYKKAIDLNPENIRSMNNLAKIILDYIKDEAMAVEYLNKIIQTAPTDAEAYNTYGNIYCNKKEYKMAQLYFQKAINFDKDYFKNYYDIAKAYIGLDDYKKAKEALNDCLKLNPDFELAKELLGKL